MSRLKVFSAGMGVLVLVCFHLTALAVADRVPVPRDRPQGSRVTRAQDDTGQAQPNRVKSDKTQPSVPSNSGARERVAPVERVQIPRKSEVAPAVERVRAAR